YVVLKVYDVLGNEVATLVNEYKTPGNYAVNFDATDLTSGIYLYQMKAGKNIQTRKLMVLK
ncbi:MAG TPA: T9SS type A sorting domain-containing protein, partial [Candidatus Marinimicrobia bacterium]|nr:T9SS type A sorting domain-containing protein [Candidatus Neomarinimicrobiota bacterium]